MGYLHYDAEHEFMQDDFEVTSHGIYLDYVEGRMVKLNIYREGRESDEYEIPDNPRHDYQSWVRVYPRTEDLVNSVLKG